MSKENLAKLDENITLANPLDFVGSVPAALKCTHQIVGEIIIEHQIAHRCSSMVRTVSAWLAGFPTTDG
jgi:hypothetical protein